MHKNFTLKLKSSIKSFTLIELIIVIIIVGILAAVGMSQYSLIVEKSRTVEAKVRIGAMRTLAYNYYLENVLLGGMQNADVGVDDLNCASTGFYSYWISFGGTSVFLAATRCTAGGKAPNASRAYWYYMQYYPGTDQSDWHCRYVDDGSPCFGLPA